MADPTEVYIINMNNKVWQALICAEDNVVYMDTVNNSNKT